MKPRVIFSFLAIIVCSLNLSAQWTNHSGPLNQEINSMIYFKGSLFVATEDSGVFISSNEGKNWSKFDIEDSIIEVQYFYKHKNLLFAGTKGRGLQYLDTTDNKWKKNPLEKNIVNSIWSRGQLVVVGTSNGLNISNDNGQTWSDGGLKGGIINAVTGNDSMIIAGSFANLDGGVFISKDSTKNWKSLNSPSSIRSIILSDSNIFIGTNSGVYTSIGSTNIWEKICCPEFAIGLSFEQNKDFLFAGLSNKIIFAKKSEKIWKDVTGAIPYAYTGSLVIEGDKLFAGTGGGIWSRELNSFPLFLLYNKDVSVSNYSVSQNFPNPFNSSTRIYFRLPEHDNVVLTIFDVVGKRIKVIEKPNLSSGTHYIDFISENLPSSVYFYKITTSKYSEVRKMFLLK